MINCEQSLAPDRATAAHFSAVSFFNLFRFSVAFMIRRPPGEACVEAVEKVK